VATTRRSSMFRLYWPAQQQRDQVDVLQCAMAAGTLPSHASPRPAAIVPRPPIVPPPCPVSSPLFLETTPPIFGIDPRSRPLRFTANPHRCALTLVVSSLARDSLFAAHLRRLHHPYRSPNPTLRTCRKRARVGGCASGPCTFLGFLGPGRRLGERASSEYRPHLTYERRVILATQVPPSA
jgi:hypothetical protein